MPAEVIVPPAVIQGVRRNVSAGSSVSWGLASPVHRSGTPSRTPSPLPGGRVEYQKGCWTPKAALTVFMLTNFVTYYDRGVIAGALSQIKTDKDIGPLSDQSAGLLVSMFMVGYMVFSPIFASVGGRFAPGHIVVFGLSAWVLAALLSGLAWSYAVLLLARCMVGIGEAAYAGFIPPMIDDFSPPEKRTLNIGLYFSMIPFGQAAGMAAGGIVASTSGVGRWAGWQVAFLAEVLPMTILIFITFAYCPKERMGGLSNLGTKQEELPLLEGSTYCLLDNDCLPAKVEYPTVREAILRLLCNPIWVLTTLGACVYTFTIGGIAAWAVDYLHEGPLHMNTGTGAACFGLVTAMTGLIGTTAGGIFVDTFGGSKSAAGIYNCELFNTVMIAVALPVGIVMFFCSVQPAYFLLCSIVELALFATTAPANCALLESVTLEMRTYAMAFNNFAIHALGDFMSPVLIGALSDAFSHGCSQYGEEHGHTEMECAAAGCYWILSESSNGKSICVYETQLRNALIFLFGFLALAAIAWGAATVYARRQLSRHERHQRVARIN
eukprot:TRINITY_DN13114_c0_g1_i1.p1 TRINITY_DN13114_c0_g1~~TRINITY_DN13114_c0_g1_i1.p1  ORF type:complete len:551 (+),score=58.78 TRINITY_DN13114_c0_g1_i1:82-1734(+)